MFVYLLANHRPTYKNIYTSTKTAQTKTVRNIIEEVGLDDFSDFLARHV